MNTATRTYRWTAPKALLVVISSAVSVVLLGFAAGVLWSLLRIGFLVGFGAMMLLLGGCADTMIRPTYITENEVALQYDATNSWTDVQRRADELCAGRQAKVISRWDNIGTKGATFHCEG